MFSDRYVVYYSKVRNYAVRWRNWGDPEEDASYARFDNKVEAERLFNSVIQQRQSGDVGDGPVELFYSQSKWVRYHDIGRDDTGAVRYVPAGKVSAPCLSGAHHMCEGDPARNCTCPHHLDGVNGQVP